MTDSDVVIRVEGLGKKYALHHEKSERYTALRDVVARQARAAGRLLNPFTLAGQLRRAQREAAAERAESEEDFWALKDVSFEIRRGERVGIIGRNGAGKSTLLKILSRITEPTTGRVEIRGRVASLLEVGTGFHPELTGRENIYLNGAILGMTRREIRSKFDEIVDFAEVEKFLDTPVKRYSSGMYVRLAFAVAAHLEPEILVVDEVLAVGDASFQKKCLGKMEEVSDGDGRTVLFVSHQMGTISKLCSRSALLVEGSIAYQGDSEKTIQYYLDSVSTKGFTTNTNRSLKTNDTKEIAIESVIAKTASGNSATAFQSEEEITLEIRCRVNQWLDNTVMGFYVINQRGTKVFTHNNPAWEKLTGIHGLDAIISTCKIPKSFLAPGQYIFTFAISIHHQRTVDIAQDCLTISVLDTGSQFNTYEGYDYGVVFAPCHWSLSTN